MPVPDISTLTSAPNRIISVTFGGRFFRCTQRTYAALLDLQTKVARHKKGAFVQVIQGSYNTGVALSAGTHDYDAVVDIKIVGFTWQDAESFCRAQGWAAWWRHTGSWASPLAWHIHMALLGAPQAGSKVGKYIDGGVTIYGHVVTSSQYDDYRAHKSGLVGHAADPTWHPANINSTIFNYAEWLEDNMPLSDKDVQRIAQATAPLVVKTLLQTELGPDSNTSTVRQALARSANVPDLVRQIKAAVVEAVKPTPTKKS